MSRRTLYSNTSFLKATWTRTATFVSSFFKPALALETPLGPLDVVTTSSSLSSSSSSTLAEYERPIGSSLADCLWLAVPKRKVTPGKKRMKTTNQKRIQKKDHIIVDGRTGEITLRHRLPFNWKDYLPGNNTREN